MKKLQHKSLSVTRETLRHLVAELPRESLRRVNGGSIVNISTSLTQIATGDTGATTETRSPDQPF